MNKPAGGIGVTDSGYRYRNTVYRISVLQSDAIDDRSRLSLDGAVQEQQSIVLTDDGLEHQVEIRLPHEA